MLPSETLAKLGRDLRLIGTFHVVFGAVQCLSLVGALVGVPYILFGLRSRDSGLEFARYAELADELTLADAHRHLADGMKMLKFACLATIVLLAISFVVSVFVIASILTHPLLRAAMSSGG